MKKLILFLIFLFSVSSVYASFGFDNFGITSDSYDVSVDWGKIKEVRTEFTCDSTFYCACKYEIQNSTESFFIMPDRPATKYIPLTVSDELSGEIGSTKAKLKLTCSAGSHSEWIEKEYTINYPGEEKTEEQELADSIMLDVMKKLDNLNSRRHDVINNITYLEEKVSDRKLDASYVDNVRLYFENSDDIRGEAKSKMNYAQNKYDLGLYNAAKDYAEDAEVLVDEAILSLRDAESEIRGIKELVLMETEEQIEKEESIEEKSTQLTDNSSEEITEETSEEGDDFKLSLEFSGKESVLDKILLFLLKLFGK